MLGGRYFYLCIDSSTNARKVFRYNQIKNGSDRSKLNSDIHPFFIIFNEASIDFCENRDQKIDKTHISHFQTRFKIPIENLPFRDGDLANYLINYFDENINITKKIEDDNKFVFVEQKDGKTISFKIIFLHLLYDILYSDVFLNDTRYYSLVPKLFESYFVTCIAAKGNYLYWKNEYIKLRSGGGEINYKYILNRYWEADKDWINLIIDNGKNEILNVSNDWFYAPDLELESLLLSSKIYSNNKNVDRITLLKQLLSDPFKSNQNYRKEIQLQRDDIYSFYLFRFNNNGLSNILYNYHDNTVQLNYIFLIIFIFYLLYSFNLIDGLPWIILISIFYFRGSYLFYNKKINTNDFYILVPLLSIILSFKEQLNAFVLIIFCLFIVGFQQNLLRQFFFSIRRIRFPNKINYFNNSIGFPKMSLAITAVWIGFIPICDEAWALNVNIKNTLGSYFLLFGFLLVVCASVFYFVNNSISRLGLGFSRSIGIIIHGLSISVLIGVFAMEVSRENLFSKVIEFFPDEHGVYEISILDTTSSILQKEMDLNISVNKPINFNLISQKIEYLKDSLNYIDKDSLNYRSKLFNNYNSNSIFSLKQTVDSIKSEKIEAMADAHTNKIGKYGIPAIQRFEMFSTRYIFPKLLLIYALFAFYIGLFVEVAFKGTRYKENL